MSKELSQTGWECSEERCFKESLCSDIDLTKSLFKIKLGQSSKVYSMALSELVYNLDDKCYLGLVRSPYSAEDNTWVLGSLWLKNFYIALDLD